MYTAVENIAVYTAVENIAVYTAVDNQELNPKAQLNSVQASLKYHPY